MSEPNRCPKGHAIPEGMPAPRGVPMCPTCAGLTEPIVAALTAAIRSRVTPPFRVFAVKTVDHGEIVVQSVSAEVVRMSDHGHLLFFTKDGNLVRIYAQNTWYSMRDVTSEGPDAVAAFLKEMHGEGAGTA